MDYGILKASDGTGNAVLAKLTQNRLAASSTLTVDSVDNWPAKFIATIGTVGSNNLLIPSTVREFVGHLDTGTANTIIVDSWEPGSANDGNSINQVVIVKQTVGWANRVADAALAMDTFVKAQGDWRLLSITPTLPSDGNKGNKEHALLYSGVDLSTVLSPGMRMKVNRTGTVPTQSADFESSSSQYATRAAASVTGTLSTITDGIFAEAWIYLESYTGQPQTIVARRTSSGEGFQFRVEHSGELAILGFTATQYEGSMSNQLVPLNQWVHVAAWQTLAGSIGATWINGLQVTSRAYTGGASGLAAWSYGANSDLAIGRAGSSALEYFDGRISDVRLWNVNRTSLQIRDNMNIQLVGNETGLIGYWKLNGNFNDSTTAANHLTASGGAIATFASHPFKATEYGIVTKVTYSAPNTTVTVFTGTDHNIPNATLAAPHYSTIRAPFGFPAQSTKWRYEVCVPTEHSVNGPAVNGVYNLGGFQINLQTGEWLVGFDITAGSDGGTQGRRDVQVVLSTSASAISDPDFLAAGLGIGVNFMSWYLSKRRPVGVTVPTLYYLNCVQRGAASVLFLLGSSSTGNRNVVYAECAYV